jgi:hypothetical protein
MWVQYNPNPTGRLVGDCSIRAVAKALNLDWDTTYDMVSHNAKLMGDMPSSDSVWGAVLRQNGFNKVAVPNTCPDCYTAEDFCKDNPHGVFVLGFGGHTATVINGNLYDSWNSSNLIPIYYWFRKE